MKQILSILLLQSLLFSCSNNDDSSELQATNLSFTIQAVNVDMTDLVYFINDNYADPNPACYSSTVKSGDKITVCGGMDIQSIVGVVKKDGIITKQIELQKSGTLLQQSIQYHPCMEPNSTVVMANVPLWKNGSDNTVSLTIN